MRQMRERLRGGSRGCGSAATKSSRLHRVAGQGDVAGFWVAIASISTRSAGGNALRRPRARGLLQAVEAVRQLALPPTADRMALTGHLGGHVQSGGAVWRGDPEDQPTAQGQGLGGGLGPHKRS